jgi:hypothetical protein
MSRKIVPTTPKKAQKKPLLSRESAERQYDLLLESYHSKRGLGSKVSGFFHDLEHDILKEITGIQMFFDKFDPNDRDKPFKEKRIIEQGQWGWLIEHQEHLDRNGERMDDGFIARTIISGISDLKPWRNKGEHDNEMTPVKYLNFIQTMADIISFFSGVPIPENINKIIHNQAVGGFPDGSTQNVTANSQKSDVVSRKKPKAKFETARTTPVSAECSIEVSAKFGGKLYFQGKEIATLWDNETYNIPIEKPGVYDVKIIPTVGIEITKNVAVTSRGVTQVDFGYCIGSRGPAGGIIFYDKKNNSDGWRYLEAANVEDEIEFERMDTTSLTTCEETGTSVGSGRQNTQKLFDRFKRVNNLSGRTTIAYAEKLNFGGFHDWFLPSKDELNLMYINLKRNGLGNFNNGYYWSSSADNHRILIQEFINGNSFNIIIYHADSSMMLFRPIRAF